MTIAVADDLECIRANLCLLLKKYFAAKNTEVNISVFSDGSQLINDFNKGKYQLIFLDIYMKDMNGIDTAKLIRSKDSSCPIVFITTSNSFAAESYEVNACGYLIKPVTEEKLFAVMDRLTYNHLYNTRTLTIRSKGKNSVDADIRYADILYIDVMKKVVRVHTKDKIIEIANTFSECAEILLNDNRFSNCCRSIIVNFDYVTGISGNDFQMSNGDMVSIRNHGGQMVKKDYMSYRLKTL